MSETALADPLLITSCVPLELKSLTARARVKATGY